MRKADRIVCLAVTVVLITGAFATVGLAQERPDTVVSLNGSGIVDLYEEEVGVTGALFRGAVGLEYEKAWNANSSWYVVPSLTFGEGIPGIRTTFGYKNYTKGTAPEGF